ncbi:retinaldehyde-binding protein 1 [Euwallacea similis]|uniref:retinaldehyde-binding protein 1 n=1 Tax=Euwallacea similis TaxID=1736056 RepID=UPI00344F74C9
MSTQLLIAQPQWSNSDRGLEVDVSRKQTVMTRKELSKVAEVELRETEHTKAECLAQLRTWIEQNEDIRNCPMDDVFLLRFLRVKKFSIPMAQQTLLKYLNYRKRFPLIFNNMDYNEGNVSELISSGYIFASPLRDTHGRRVIIYNLGKLDTKKFTGTDMAKAHAITYETLLADEANQILGLTHVADFREANPSIVTLFSVTDFLILLRWGEQSFPMRHKEIHLLNMPPALKYVYDFTKSHMSKKLKARLMVHDTPSALLQKVPKGCVPKDLGGDVSMKEMILGWQQELDAKRKKLLTYDNVELLSDRGIICSKNVQNQTNLVGSFRRLEVD